MRASPLLLILRIKKMYPWTLAFIFIILGVVIMWLYREGTKHTLKFSVLELYSKDLTKAAREGKIDPVIGRKHEIDRVIQILCRRTKNNPVLIGKSGVGKTAIVEELATEIASGEVPELLTGKRLLALDLSGLVAGTKYRGEFEKRLKALTDEIIAAQRKIILFIDELHTLAEAGEATGAINAADILKPALARGELQVVGASTMQDYEKYVSKDLTLERRFQPVMVYEPTEESTLEILQGIRARYEQHHGVRISDDALRAAVTLSGKYLHDRVFPDKAIDLVDEAAARVRLKAMESEKYHEPVSKEVTGKDIEEIMNQWKVDAASMEDLKNTDK